MATHSSIVRRIPWTEELVGYSPQGRKVNRMAILILWTHEFFSDFMILYNCFDEFLSKIYPVMPLITIFGLPPD